MLSKLFDLFGIKRKKEPTQTTAIVKQTAEPTKKNPSLEERISPKQEIVKDNAYYLKKYGPFIPIDKRIKQYELQPTS